MLKDVDYGVISLADVSLRARIHYRAGNLDAAIHEFEQLDVLGRLDAKGIEALAHYYGENQQFRKKHLTLARLADSHLNERDSRIVLGFFEAFGMSEQQLSMLEAMQRRGFTTLPEQIKLARLYRYAGQHDRSLQLFEALIMQDVSDASWTDIRILVHLMERVDRQDEVETLLTRWMDTSSDDQDLTDRLRLLMSLKRYDMVVKYAETDRKLNPELDRFYGSALYNVRMSSSQRQSQYAHWLTEQLTRAEGTANVANS